MTEGTATSKFPVAIFELLPTGRSGFIREDTLHERKEDQIEIRFPKKRWINRASVVLQRDETLDADVEVPIRWVKNSPYYLEKDILSRNLKITFDRPEFVNGLLTVGRTGNTVGLYDFLKNHAQNATNAKRVSRLKALFKEIIPSAKSKKFNGDEFDIAEAVTYLRQFVKKTATGFEYQEERIDALCTEFNAYADEYDTKMELLLKIAKEMPLDFLDKAKKTEQMAVIHVNHGITMKVITFEGNTAMYLDGTKKIKSFAGNLPTLDKKVTQLANFFQTADGKAQYEEFLEKLKAAKDADVNNN